MSGFRVGVDIGGTFTDLLLLTGDGRIVRKKILSTPDDYSRGVLEALREVLVEQRLDGRDIESFIHGTTVATNAVLENSGPPVGLLTTRGFRDVLEIGRCRWGPDIYDLSWTKPAPLIPRRHRREIDERMSAQGDVLTAPGREQIVRELGRLRRAGVRTVAVCLLNSYANPAHEQLVKEWAAAAYPDLTVCVALPGEQVSVLVLPVAHRLVASLIFVAVLVLGRAEPGDLRTGRPVRLPPSLRHRVRIAA